MTVTSGSIRRDGANVPRLVLVSGSATYYFTQNGYDPSTEVVYDTINGGTFVVGLNPSGHFTTTGGSAVDWSMPQASHAGNSYFGFDLSGSVTNGINLQSGWAALD